MKFAAVALKNRDGYFLRGERIEVEIISPSVVRAYGVDWKGRPWNCLTLVKNIAFIGGVKHE